VELEAPDSRGTRGESSHDLEVIDDTLAHGLPLHTEAPPLQVDDGGAVRVGNSRISLDLIVEQYESGMTPEEMVRAFDTLVLADVQGPMLRMASDADVHGEIIRGLRRRGSRAPPEALNRHKSR
jgi:uncharacterized protein (DUF433 family)